ncbi:HdeA/HdeB family chaperone [Providencia hangzhouensis]|uniref:HdeA/HdeB family chaperone n=1 Tax=Providencia hangzhouensis TaxID=3031799 RepID=UPI0034DD366E
MPQFINLDPQSWAPVALWVTNQETQFKGGDYVALTEQSVAEVPQIVEFFKKKPEGTLQVYFERLRNNANYYAMEGIIAINNEKNEFLYCGRLETTL